MENTRITNGVTWGKVSSNPHEQNYPHALSSGFSSKVKPSRTTPTVKEVEYKRVNEVIHLSTALIKRGI